MQVNVISPSEKSIPMSHHSPEVRAKALAQRIKRKNHKSHGADLGRYHTQKLSLGGSPSSPTKTSTRLPGENFLSPKMVKKLEKYDNMLAPIQEIFEQDALMSAQSPVCK